MTRIDAIAPVAGQLAVQHLRACGLRRQRFPLRQPHAGGAVVTRIHAPNLRSRCVGELQAVHARRAHCQVTHHQVGTLRQGQRDVAHAAFHQRLVQVSRGACGGGDEVQLLVDGVVEELAGAVQHPALALQHIAFAHLDWPLRRLVQINLRAAQAAGCQAFDEPGLGAHVDRSPCQVSACQCAGVGGLHRECRACGAGGGAGRQRQAARAGGGRVRPLRQSQGLPVHPQLGDSRRAGCQAPGPDDAAQLPLPGEVIGPAQRGLAGAALRAVSGDHAAGAELLRIEQERRTPHAATAQVQARARREPNTCRRGQAAPGQVVGAGMAVTAPLGIDEVAGCGAVRRVQRGRGGGAAFGGHHEAQGSCLCERLLTGQQVQAVQRGGARPLVEGDAVVRGGELDRAGLDGPHRDRSAGGRVRVDELQFQRAAGQGRGQHQGVVARAAAAHFGRGHHGAVAAQTQLGRFAAETGGRGTQGQRDGGGRR